MNNSKSYEILTSLPAYGPMYIPISENNPTYYSEGFVVRFFKSDGTNWVANFEAGWTDLKTVIELSNPLLLIIAYGCCYILNPDQEKAISAFGVTYHTFLVTDIGQIVLCDNTNLTIVEPSGDFWHSEQLSLDGIKELKLEKNNRITGVAYEPSYDKEEWVNFTYDIDSRSLKNVQDRFITSKKAWWKFW
jgi:hypothetical protein